MKILKKIIITILVIYLLANIYLFFNQKNMLYFPDKTDFYSCENFIKEEKKFFVSKNFLLDIDFYEVKGIKNNVIIFFHGNAGRACDRVKILENLRKTGNTIIFIEYSGYANIRRNFPGNKEKVPNIKRILDNVDGMGEYLKRQKFDKIFVMGRSLGAGPASYFASKYKTDKLLLISAYDELYKVAAEKYPIFPIKYLFTQNYNSKKYLKNYKNNFLLIHGKNDKVIPYNHGLDLFKSLENKNKKMISLEKANHHNIFTMEVEKNIVEYFE